MKKTMLLAIMLIGLFSLLIAHGHDCGHSRRTGKSGSEKHGMMQKQHKANHFLMMRKELELTDKQVKSMEQNRIDTKKEVASLEAQLKIAKIEHTASMKNKEFGKAKTYSNQMLDVKKQISVKRIELKEKQWNLLTKAQQQKWEELKLERPHHQMQQDSKMKHSPRKK